MRCSLGIGCGGLVTNLLIVTGWVLFVAGGAEGRFESSVRVVDVLVDEFLLWCVGFVGV